MSRPLHGSQPVFGHQKLRIFRTTAGPTCTRVLVIQCLATLVSVSSQQTEKAASASSRSSSPLLPIFLVVAVDVLGMTLILPLLPFYTERLGASPTVVGAL